MKDFTVIWEDRWQSGSHHYSLTKKTWIRANDIHTLMIHPKGYGERARYIFEGFHCSIGESFKEDDVVTLD